MKITAKGEYACLAIIALSRHGLVGPPLHALAIARHFDIPKPFLARILLRLKSAGLVESERGTFGGYRLARPVESISLGEVLHAVDGIGEPGHEVQGLTARILSAVLQRVREAENSVLHQVSMAQLAARAEEVMPHPDVQAGPVPVDREGRSAGVA